MGLQIPQRTYFNTAANTPGLFDSLLPENQLKYQQLQAAQAFSGGVPVDGNGNPDYAAMAKTLFSKGDYADATNLAQTGTSLQLMRAAQSPSGVLGGGGPPTPTQYSSSSASGKGFNPEVVNYIRTSAADPSRKIAPDVALGVAAAEGLRGFDPNGKPNLGDDGSSAGPFQLHYGGVAGGPNASPGLGDEFTKKTGLDARDPSTWKQQVDFALDYAAKNGWGPWHGAAKAGIGQFTGIGGQQSQQGSQPAPVKVAQNGADDSTDGPVSSQHPFAPSSPPFQKGNMAAPPRMSPAGGQPQPSPQPMMLSGGAPAPATQPAPMAPPPQPIQSAPTAPAGPNLIDPTLGGIVSQAQLQAYGSPGAVARAALEEASQNSTNPYAAKRVALLQDFAGKINAALLQAEQLTPEQKNARDVTAVGYEQQRDAFKAQARVNAQNSSVAVQGAAAKAEAGEEGKQLGQIPGQLATAADSARSQNSMIDQMLDAANGFSMGKFADKEQALNASMSALGHKLGVDTSSIDGKVAAYEDFGKLAGQFSRQAMKETGGRAGGIQELRFITNTLPSPTMSPAGFQAVGNQLKGMGDFSIAKQQAGEAWLNQNGSMKGFDADWNKNVTPGTFVMRRLQVDQPEVFSTTVKRLAQSPQGRAALQSIKSGLTWAGSNGLLQ